MARGIMGQCVGQVHRGEKIHLSARWVLVFSSLFLVTLWLKIVIRICLRKLENSLWRIILNETKEC